MGIRTLTAALLFLVAAGRPALGQGYSLRLDFQTQSMAYRGFQKDSIPASQVVVGPTGGFETPTGYAASCTPGLPYCDFWVAGPRIQAVPVVGDASGTVWGLGLRGLSLHAQARFMGNLGDPNSLAGTDPAVQLLEGYAEYARDWFSSRLGRQIITGRLGYTGFDGVLASVQIAPVALGVSGFVGFGLAQGTSLPPTSPVLNPFNEFQPSTGGVVAGLAATWGTTWLDLRADYQREVDRDPQNLVSERASLSGTVKLARGWQLAGGADYDIAFNFLGNADANLSYQSARISGSLGVRQYRPFFNLWTIWGAFSPVPYHAVDGTFTVNLHRLQLNGFGELYQYDDAEVSTGLVDVVDNGWRWNLGASYRFSAHWEANAGLGAAYGPGASALSGEGQVVWTPRSSLRFATHVGALNRPLEYRFDDAKLFWFGLQADYQPSPRLSLGGTADLYTEDRDTQDAASFDWSQVRLSARVTYFINSKADAAPLPPAVRWRPADK